VVKLDEIKGLPTVRRTPRRRTSSRQVWILTAFILVLGMLLALVVFLAFRWSVARSPEANRQLARLRPRLAAPISVRIVEPISRMVADVDPIGLPSRMKRPAENPAFCDLFTGYRSTLQDFSSDRGSHETPSSQASHHA
jgi:hypothetical protein